MRWLLLATVILVTGCGKSGPTYDEALATYKTELELLDQTQREADAKIARMNGEIRDAIDRLDEPKVTELSKARDAEQSRLDDIVSKQRERVGKALAVKDAAEKDR